LANPLYCLDFNYELVLNNDIHSISTIQANILVNDRQAHLPTMSNPGLLEFEA